MKNLRTLVAQLYSLENPRFNMEGNIFSIVIDYLNPNSGEIDETSVNLDCTDKYKFKDSTVKYWNRFCRKRGWNPFKANIAAVWTTLPD